MIRYIWLFSLCFGTNPVNNWITSNKNILAHNIKSASFQIDIDSKLFNNIDNTTSAKIFIADNKQFRLELENRTIVSDGQVWQVYDLLTDQIFLQEPDSKIEKILFSWVKTKKLKALPVKKIDANEYKIILLDKNNNIRTYFNNENNLEYILIINEESQTKISNIKLKKEESINLEVGNINTEIFDLR